MDVNGADGPLDDRAQHLHPRESRYHNHALHEYSFSSKALKKILTADGFK